MKSTDKFTSKRRSEGAQLVSSAPKEILDAWINDELIDSRYLRREVNQVNLEKYRDETRNLEGYLCLEMYDDVFVINVKPYDGDLCESIETHLRKSGLKLDASVADGFWLTVYDCPEKLKDELYSILISNGLSKKYVYIVREFRELPSGDKLGVTVDIYGKDVVINVLGNNAGRLRDRLNSAVEPLGKYTETVGYFGSAMLMISNVDLKTMETLKSVLSAIGIKPKLQNEGMGELSSFTFEETTTIQNRFANVELKPNDDRMIRNNIKSMINNLEELKMEVPPVELISAIDMVIEIYRVKLSNGLKKSYSF